MMVEPVGTKDWEPIESEPVGSKVEPTPSKVCGSNWKPSKGRTEPITSITSEPICC